MTDRYDEGRAQAIQDARTRPLWELIREWEERPDVEGDQYELGYYKGLQAAARMKRYEY